MKILFLANRLPFPIANGEDLRVYHFAKHLSRRHELHMLAYSRGSGEPTPEYTDYFRRVHTIDSKPEHTSKRKSLWALLHSLSPNQMCEHDDRLEARLTELLRQSFDLVWVPSWEMFPYVRGLRTVPIFLDVMDDGVLELARELRSARSFANAVVTTKRLWVTYLFERKYLQDARLCVFVAATDAEAFRRICPRANVTVIPNGVDNEFFEPLGNKEQYPSLIFEGNMSFFPNIDAALYFRHEIFPRVARSIPGVRFYVVGRDPSREIEAIASEQIIVTGSVADVRPYLDAASVFVCPMRKGAGIKNKLLQAWAMAKPVVATSVALGGVKAEAGKNVLIADEPDKFAKHVIELLKDSELRRSLGQYGRETVLAHHSWERQVTLLENHFAEI